MTRRAALGVTTALFGSAVTLGAGPPRGSGAQDEEVAQEAHPACGIRYDAEFEQALEAADAEIPEEPAGLERAAPSLCALPLRRGYRVTARYRVRGDWLAGYHTGIDLAVPRGTPVYAVRAGVVVLAQRSGDYGNAVTIRMPDGCYAVYGHLQRIRTRKGARISTGMRLGDSGSTGRATGPHLHLEIRNRRPYGADVDPVRYLAKRGVRL
ncbi:M23 family metallopeptidase [Streptomyces sp. SID14478]|uniref:M23 family metallopeptidase n=1 Tax=Streptomyces sp. SID14478 TaxID=2706073 RepID=UPI0013DD06EF|nr:peptidoglycan DD-metalloendopeptidase family protein [Streptomyces sp. SID14478]NEB78653.1 M23 family metallopeptidase [Streptomyces sp. SID14478]